jgi:hypothetical protein
METEIAEDARQKRSKTDRRASSVKKSDTDRLWTIKNEVRGAEQKASECYHCVQLRIVIATVRLKVL